METTWFVRNGKLFLKNQPNKEYKKLPKRYQLKISELLNILQINPLSEVLPNKKNSKPK